jgi:hypothetical protein
VCVCVCVCVCVRGMCGIVQASFEEEKEVEEGRAGPTIHHSHSLILLTLLPPSLPPSLRPTPIRTTGVKVQSPT